MMKFDAVVIGAGHNGLVAAAYLARAGKKVKVLERRHLVGGACVTEELWPGFRVSRAAYVAGLLRPKIIQELFLNDFGLKLLPRNPSSFTPLQGSQGLLLGADAKANFNEIAAFSRRDAERYGEYEAFLDRIARVLEPTLDQPPPDPKQPSLRDFRLLVGLLRRGIGLRSQLPEALALLLGPARSTLERWFESEPLRATLATDAIIGAWAAPSTAGTGYVLFHHVMGDTGGARGVWAYVQGGMGGLSEALRKSAIALGAEIECDAAVRGISIQKGAVCGVELEDGRCIEAPLVLSNLDPQRTLLDLVGEQYLHTTTKSAVETLDFRSPSLKINLALDRLPQFTGRSNNGLGPEHHGTIHVGANTLDQLDASFEAATKGELPERPMVEMTLPSALDSTLAPDGKYVASLFVQHVPHDWSEAQWDAKRDIFAKRVFSLVDEVAPGFSSSVLHHEVLAPCDLERVFALTGGNLFHGAMSLDRLAFMRPYPGGTGYATVVPGLFLCGSGTHPGGGVMGACGRNAALAALRNHS